MWPDIMSEKELQSLKSLPVPPVSETAKRRALAAALDAYDNPDVAAKGLEAQARPTPRSHPETRRKFMTLTRSQYAIAASLAALVVAAPIAFRVMQETRFEPSIGEDSRRKPELAQEPAAGGERDEGRSVIINEPAAATTQPAKPAEPAPSVVVPNAGSLKVEEAAKANDAPAPGMDAKAKPERGIAQLGAAPRVDGRAAEMALGAAPALPATTGYEGQISLGKTDVTASATAERLADRRLLGAVPSATAVPAPVQIREPYAYLADADRQRQAAEPEFRDKFEAKEVNPVKQVAAEPVSTFSIDVDTASFAFVRRALIEGRLPP